MAHRLKVNCISSLISLPILLINCCKRVCSSLSVPVSKVSATIMGQTSPAGDGGSKTK